MSPRLYHPGDDFPDLQGWKDSNKISAWSNDITGNHVGRESPTQEEEKKEEKTSRGHQAEIRQSGCTPCSAI